MRFVLENDPFEEEKKSEAYLLSRFLRNRWPSPFSLYAALLRFRLGATRYQ